MILCLAGLRWAGQYIPPAEGLGEVLGLELAGSPEAAARLIAPWGREARVAAGFSLGLDYVFLFAYSTSLALGSLWAGSGFASQTIRQLGVALAWGQWLAGLFDAVENAALIEVLLGPIASPWPEIARAAALAKFGLVLVGNAFILAGTVRRAAGRT